MRADRHGCRSCVAVVVGIGVGSRVGVMVGSGVGVLVGWIGTLARVWQV